MQFVHNIAMNKSKMDSAEHQLNARSAPKHAKCSRQLKTLDIIKLNQAWEGRRELLIPTSSIAVLEMQYEGMTRVADSSANLCSFLFWQA